MKNVYTSMAESNSNSISVLLRFVYTHLLYVGCFVCAMGLSTDRYKASPQQTRQSVGWYSKVFGPVVLDAVYAVVSVVLQYSK